MATVTLQGIEKSYGDVPALQGVNLRLPNGRTTVVIGPSGCGKSTLLRIVAGLEHADAGTVYFDGRDMDAVAPKDRRLGVVFQDSALYPGMSSRQNVLSWFVFRRRDLDTDPEVAVRMARTAELMGVELERLLARNVKGMSPGEQQRVALARCITREPSLFLLDEPLAHLDAPERTRIRVELKRLLHEFRVTTMYITHDQADVPVLAENLVVMNEGRIAQEGTPNELYQRPASLFVAGFVNSDPLVPALDTVPGWRVAQRFGGRVLGLRSEDVRLVDPREADATGAVGLVGRIVDSMPLPSRRSNLLALECAGDGGPPLRVHAVHPTDAPDVPIGTSAFARFERFHVFDETSGRRIATEP